MPRISKSFTLGEIKQILLEQNKEFDTADFYNQNSVLMELSCEGLGYTEMVGDDNYLITLTKYN